MDPEKLKLRGTQFLPVLQSDLDAIRAIQPDDWPDVGLAYSFYLDSWFCNPMKLVLDEKIIGIGCLISFEITAWLGQIIVIDFFRNQGLGSYITRQLMEMVSPEIQTISLLATTLGEPVYRKIGFEPDGVYTFLKKNEQIVYTSSIEIIPCEIKYQHSLLHLDREVSGEDRSRLIKHFLVPAWIYLENENVIAYYLPALGDGLIVSRDPAAGVELIKMKLASKKINVIPEQNKLAHEFLSEQGYDPYRRATRMFVGKRIAYQGEFIYSRIGGNLG